MIKIPYEAVDKDTLIRKLGRQCSPDRNRGGYVIGPDTNGRICHVASCVSMEEARNYATTLNKNIK